MKNLFNLCFLFLFMLSISVYSPAQITFTNVTLQSGIGDPGTRAATWGDYDNDGDIDLYVGIGLLANTPSRLFRNNGNGNFTNVTQAANVENYARPSEGAGFGDYDNDGWLDIFAGNNGLNSLYHNNRDGTFTNIAAQVGIIENGNTMIVSSGDYNGDGFLDLFMTNGFLAEPGPDALYRNSGNDNHWLHINLVGVRSNRDGIGARIHVSAGDLTMFREVNGGTFGMDSLTAEFGLGEHNMAEMVEIRWPSGAVDVLSDVPAGCIIQVTEGTEHFTVAVQPRGKLPITLGEVKQTALRTAMLQNYPNPFNPETWIPYRLGKDSVVAIKICASSGQLMRTLELGRKPAGFYTGKTEAAHWDGNNESGEPVASGVYFYTIQADDYTATKKMILAK